MLKPVFSCVYSTMEITANTNREEWINRGGVAFETSSDRSYKIHETLEASRFSERSQHTSHTLDDSDYTQFSGKINLWRKYRLLVAWN